MTPLSVRLGLALVACLLAAGRPASAITLADPANYRVKATWSGASLGIPPPLGGLLFSADGTTLYVVGDSEGSASALYAVPVTRDLVSGEVTSLGPAGAVTKAFDGHPGIAGLDAGFDFGPGGTLFYTYWSANYLGQRPGGVTGAESVFDMAASPTALPSSIAGLTFSPHMTDPRTGFGKMQVSVWSSAGNRNLYDIDLDAPSGGVYPPIGKDVLVTLPREGTGSLQYVPSGPLAGNLLYVNWDYGEVRVLRMDATTGLPIDQGTGLPTRGTSNPQDDLFASDLGVGPWGLEFDPRTNDFFLSTWSGDPEDTIVQIGGAGFPPPSVATTTTTTLPPREDCANCRDDDGDGLVDVEDPDCCREQAPSALVLKRARIAPAKSGGSRLALTGDLPQADLGTPPVPRDIVLQIRAGDGDGLCALVPAARVGARKTGLTFTDPKGTVTSARGLARLKLRLRRSGGARLAAKAKRAALPSLSGGPVRVALALRDPAGTAAAGQCGAALATFRASRKRALRFP